MRPNKIIQKKINLITDVRKYNIIHFRLHDNEFNKIRRFITYIYEFYCFMRHYKKNDIFITNSFHFKNIIARYLKVNYIDIVPQHSGQRDIDGDLEGTMLEFFLASRAQTIKTYSVYPWISGFMKSISVLYNIPLKSIGKK